MHLNSRVDAATLNELELEHVIVATGAIMRLPEVELDGVDLIDAWSVIRGEHRPGNNVVIADWSCDWAGLGIAEMLARNGHRVRLLSGGSVAGESIQAIVRDQWIGTLHSLGVEMIPYARFHGAVDDCAYFQHMTGGEPIVCEGVDTVVSCYAAQSSRDCDWLDNLEGFTLTRVGDAVAPRSVEEAVLEGLQAAWSI